jgi:sugar-specific transcriptional regulator TrmB
MSTNIDYKIVLEYTLDKAKYTIMTKKIDNVEQEAFVEKLKQLGLSEKTALVYLTLLSQEESGIAFLERETGIHRQMIYNSLESLEDLGLIRHAIVRGRKKFSAAPVQRLQSLVEVKKRLADGLVDQLSYLTPESAKQEFEIYQGNDTFVEYQLQTLQIAEEGSTLLLISSVWEKFYDAMGERGIREYEKLRNEKKIAIRYIGFESQKNILQRAKEERKRFEYRMLPGMTVSLVNTSIWQDRYEVNLFGDPTIVFVLKNKVVTESQKSFFEALWSLGTC